MEGADNFQNIKFVDDSPYLKCFSENYLKKCLLPKSHFQGKKSGYYYTHYSNDYNTSSIAYDTKPFKINLEPHLLINVKYEDNQEAIIIGEDLYTFALITDYDDSIRNIFNASDIEEKTKCNILINFTIYDDRIKHFNSSCRLWKPHDDKLRLFCKVNRLYIYSDENTFTFESASFNYNDIIVTIKTSDNFNYVRNDEPISFLYSDKQFIDLNEEKEKYELKFKYDLYNKDGLYLYSDLYSNYIPIDNCEVEEQEILCKINKSFIEQNLIMGG